METIERTLQGTSLTVDGVQALRVAIFSDPSLTDTVVLRASARRPAELSCLSFTEGDRITVSQPMLPSAVLPPEEPRGEQVPGGFLSGARSTLSKISRALSGEESLRDSILNTLRAHFLDLTLDITLLVPPAFPVSVLHKGIGDLEIGDLAGHVEVVSDASGDVNIERAGTLHLRLNSVGDASVGTVCDHLDLALTSTGDASVGTAVSASVAIDSSGDFKIDRVANRLTLEMSGTGDAEIGTAGSVRATVDAGDLTVERIATHGEAGSLDVEMNGIGNVSIGFVGSAVVRLNSAGDLKIEEMVGNLDCRSDGVGDIEIDSLTGSVTAFLDSAGCMEIRDGTIPILRVKTSSSGDFSFDGTADEAELWCNGSGGITVRKVNATAKTRSTGIGDIEVDEKPSARLWCD